MSISLFVPNDAKDEAARLGIQTHQQAITSLEAKIASLLDVVESLRDLQRDHQDQLRQCQSVLTLARRLPPELLGHIFEHCVDAHPSVPLVLSQVCSTWRMATHGMPRLWSWVSINCSERRVAEKTSHWLRMSGLHVPLDITLHVTHNASLLPVIRVLLPHTSRWANVVVDAELQFHAEDVLESIRAELGVLRNLETIDFVVHEDMESIMDFRATFDTIKCPRLHTMHFMNPSWYRATFPPQLTVFNLVIPVTQISSQFLSQTLALLRDLPILEHFSLVFSDQSFPHGSFEPVGNLMVIMARLHTLILTGCHVIFEVLAHITLPSLQHLALRETGKQFHHTITIGPSLLRMIEISSPPLKTLELYDTDTSDEDFIRCFNVLPALEGLFLHESEISNAVFRRFCSPLSNGQPSNSWLCPRLTHLDLRWCSQLSGRVLVDLVQARLMTSDAGRISEVVAINCSSIREEDVFSLAASTRCRLKNSPEDFCYHRGCCANNRYRHRFMLRHAAELRQQRNEGGRLEL